jgi:hypothetical protein
MTDMISSNLSKDEVCELQDYMLHSPYAKLIDLINQKVHES